MGAKAVELTGKIQKAYNPKRGRYEFFFEILDENCEIWKGMARLEFMEKIRVDATVRITGTVSSNWVRPDMVEVLADPRAKTATEEVFLVHVGRTKNTHYGAASFARTDNGEWLILPNEVIRDHFDNAWVPGNGQITITAEVARNGDNVVKKILSHKRRAKNFTITVPFNKMFRTFKGIQVNTEFGALRIPEETIPFSLDDEIFQVAKGIAGAMTVSGKMVASSLGNGHVGWEAEAVTVEVEKGFGLKIEALIWNKKVAAATAAVRKELDKLLEAGVVVDLDQVTEMFLKQGVKVERKTAEKLWARGYDMKYLKALQELSNGGAVWAVEDGFIIEIGNWLVWERCKVGAATYILPATPNADVTGQDLTVAEWAAVLGKILPETNKMQLRYGEVGQAISGRADGVQFAFHVETETGEFGTWLDAVKAATEKAPGEKVNGLPTLEDLGLLLAA